ncbi:MAG: hypothetical protein AAFO86_01390 [Pseudomonadota bacterium]
MDQTFLINLRVLRRLKKHMQRHHPHAFSTMVQRGRIPNFHIGGSWEHELQVLQSACVDPREFPVYVLADDKVVALIQKAQRGTVGSLWVLAAHVIYRAVTNR